MDGKERQALGAIGRKGRREVIVPRGRETKGS
jgi:hypothetical protein